MKYCYFLLIFLLGFSISSPVQAQNFQAKQRAQERTIRGAYKSGKITEREYYKLMDEQEKIKEAIHKYDSDEYWTPHEKNVVHDKLVRAEKRLSRYKTNSEIY
ncbi:MAG: hypothetical protein JSS78_07375 [Bacteroidetes bacterium]|nr:hypothetical protein [Bacteroidota bacterium]